MAKRASRRKAIAYIAFMAVLLLATVVYAGAPWFNSCIHVVFNLEVGRVLAAIIITIVLVVLALYMPRSEDFGRSC